MCHAHARPCLSTGWALNRRFGLTSGTAAVLVQGGGGYVSDLTAHSCSLWFLAVAMGMEKGVMWGKGACEGSWCCGCVQTRSCGGRALCSWAVRGNSLDFVVVVMCPRESPLPRGISPTHSHQTLSTTTTPFLTVVDTRHKSNKPPPPPQHTGEGFDRGDQ